MSHKGFWLRSGNGTASTPDTAALDITGNISLRADLVHKNWRPTALSIVLAKFNFPTSQASYALAILSTGVIRFLYTTDGFTTLARDSTVAVPATGVPTRLAIRVDRNSTTGDVTFYTAPTMTGTWVQLGAVVAGATGAMFSSTSDLRIGQYQDASQQLTDAVVRHIRVYNDVTLTVDADFSLASIARKPATVTDATSFLWTKSGTAYWAKETFNMAFIVPELAELAELFPATFESVNLNLLDAASKDLGLIPWTPEILASAVNPNFGDAATKIGFYRRLPGDLIVGWGRVQAGGSGIAAGNGNYRFRLPVERDTTNTWGDSSSGSAGGDGEIIGAGFYHDDTGGTGLSGSGVMELMTNSGGGRASMAVNAGSTTWHVDANSPFTVAAGDAYGWEFFYKGAAV